MKVEVKNVPCQWSLWWRMQQLKWQMQRLCLGMPLKTSYWKWIKGWETMKTETMLCSSWGINLSVATGDTYLSYTTDCWWCLVSRVRNFLPVSSVCFCVCDVFSDFHFQKFAAIYHHCSLYSIDTFSGTVRAWLTDWLTDMTPATSSIDCNKLLQTITKPTKQKNKITWMLSVEVERELSYY